MNTEPSRVTDRNFRFGLRFLFALVTAAALAFSCLSCLPVAVGIGGFHVTMEMKSASNREIANVAFRGLWNLDELNDRTVWYLPLEKGADKTSNGYVVWLWSSGRTDYLGRELAYHQMRFALIDINYEEGDTVRELVEIPIGYGPRTIKVNVP